MLAQHQQAQYDRQVASWLLLCAAVIFGMIMLGGVANYSIKPQRMRIFAVLWP